MSGNVFDSKAATWDDDPAKVQRARDVADAIAASVPLDGSTRLLEYGAGTGLVTQALRDRVGPVTLVDSSEGMRAVMHAKVESGALAGARIWELDLEHDPPPEGEVFDLIVTVMVLHHVHDLARVLESFAGMLEPGGHLCIADLEKEDGSFHGADFAGHHGFDRTELEAALRDAGFSGVTIDHCTDVERHGTTFAVFLATAARS